VSDYDNIPSAHWKHAEPISTGINRHRITSRQVVRAISAKQDRMIYRRWRWNIAGRLASIYDLFLGNYIHEYS